MIYGKDATKELVPKINKELVSKINSLDHNSLKRY